MSKPPTKAAASPALPQLSFASRYVVPAANLSAPAPSSTVTAPHNPYLPPPPPPPPPVPPLEDATNSPASPAASSTGKSQTGNGMRFGTRLTSIVKSEQTQKSLQRFAPAAKWFMAGAGKAMSFVAGEDSSASPSPDVRVSAGGTPDDTADPLPSSPPTWGGAQHAAASSPASPRVISSADLRHGSNGGLTALSTLGWGAGSVKSDAGSRSPAAGATGESPASASPLHHIAAAGPIPGHRRGWSNISGDAGLGAVGSSGVPWAASKGAPAAEPRPDSGWGAAEEKRSPSHADVAGYGANAATDQGLDQHRQAIESTVESDAAAPAPRFAPAAKWLLAGAGKAMTFVVGADGKADDVNADAVTEDADTGASVLAPAGAFDSEQSMPALPAPAVDTSAQEAHFSGVASLLAASEARAASAEPPQQDGGDGGGSWGGFGGFFRGRSQQQQQEEPPAEEPAQGAGEGWAALAAAQSAGPSVDVAGQQPYDASHNTAAAAADQGQYGEYVPWGSRQEVNAAPFFSGAEAEAADGGDYAAAGDTGTAAAAESAAGAGNWGSGAVPHADVPPGAAATSADSQTAAQPLAVTDYTGWGGRPTAEVGFRAAAERSSPPWRSHEADAAGFGWGGEHAAPAPDTAAWGGSSTAAVAAAVDDTQAGAQTSWGAQDSGYSGFHWQGYAAGGLGAEDAGAAAREAAASQPAAADIADSLPQAQGALWPPAAPDSGPGIAAAEEGAEFGVYAGFGVAGGVVGDGAASPGSASNPPLEPSGTDAFGAVAAAQYGQEYSQAYQHDAGGSWGAGYGDGCGDGAREDMPASHSQHQPAADYTEPAAVGWGAQGAHGAGGGAAAAAAEPPQAGFFSGLAGDTAAEAAAGDVAVSEAAEPGHADAGAVSRPPRRPHLGTCRHPLAPPAF